MANWMILYSPETKEIVSNLFKTNSSRILQLAKSETSLFELVISCVYELALAGEVDAMATTFVVPLQNDFVTVCLEGLTSEEPASTDSERTV